MIITSLIRKGKSELYKTYLNEEYVCLLEAETIVKHKLKTGQEIDQDEFARIREESENLTCRKQVLDYVSKGIKTRKQVFDHFKQKGYLPISINNALDMLEGYGYLKDKYYAQNFVKAKQNQKGKMYIVSSLKQKGVSDDIINEVLQDFATEQDVVIELAQKYLKNKVVDDKTKEKLFRHLISKGFDFSEVNSAIKSVLKNDNNNY